MQVITLLNKQKNKRSKQHGIQKDHK